MNGFTKFFNPVGVIADKVGGTFGKVLDPVNAISKKAGGQGTTAGILLSPADAIRRKGAQAFIKDPPETKPIAPTTANERGALLT